MRVLRSVYRHLFGGKFYAVQHPQNAFSVPQGAIQGFVGGVGKMYAVREMHAGLSTRREPAGYDCENEAIIA
jgi:hypothetical protein